MLDDGPALPLLTALRRDCPHSRVVVIAGDLGEGDVQILVTLGVQGCLLWRDLTVTSLRSTLEVAVCSDVLMASPSLSAVFRRVLCPAQAPGEQRPRLTSRERALLQHLAHGMAQEQMTTAERISRRTVVRTFAGLRAKLGVNGTAATMLNGVELGADEPAGGALAPSPYSSRFTHDSYISCSPVLNNGNEFRHVPCVHQFMEATSNGDASS
jgi:DNA-binding NarL/FixJ family response regulator